MKTYLLKGALPIILIFTACTQIDNKKTDSKNEKGKETTQEKVILSCNEPFMTVEIRQDLDSIIVSQLSPEDGEKTVKIAFPYTDYKINEDSSSPTYNYKEWNFGGWYQGVYYLNYYVAYKIADPANSCQDDMSGEMFELTGKIGYMTTSPFNACGKKL